MIMKHDSQVILEEGTPFSKSQIWHLQRNYYDQQGIDAWQDQVPFYVTSNPFIAHSYATVVMRFIEDWIHLHPDAITDPFYIIEIGVGTGQFSFYMLKWLTQLKKTIGLDIKLCYVMTDFTENNVNYWKNHAGLQLYLDNGILDFAQYDIEHDTQIELLNSKVCLKAGSVNNPLIAFANYLFDSVVADVFTVKGGALHSSHIKIATDSDNIQSGSPADWEHVNIEFEEQLIQEPYYKHDDFNKILFEYKNLLNSSHLQFPIGSLQGIANLAAISHQKMLLLASDKGHVSISELEDLDYPELAFHGSFSMMVNFHAIAQYVKQLGGDVFLQQPFDGFATGAFFMGVPINEMPKTEVSVLGQVDGFCPGHYFCMYEHMEKTHQQADLATLTAFLTLSWWDPGIFEMFSDRISDIMDDSDSDVVDFLSLNLPKVAANFYYTPGCHDILFDIAVYYHELGIYDSAIEYFKESQRYFDSNYELQFNLGYCYYELNLYESAQQAFEEAVRYQPNNREAKEWLRKTRLRVAS